MMLVRNFSLLIRRQIFGCQQHGLIYLRTACMALPMGDIHPMDIKIHGNILMYFLMKVGAGGRQRSHGIPTRIIF